MMHSLLDLPTSPLFGLRDHHTPSPGGGCDGEAVVWRINSTVVDSDKQQAFPDDVREEKH